MAERKGLLQRPRRRPGALHCRQELRRYDRMRRRRRDRQRRWNASPRPAVRDDPRRGVAGLEQGRRGGPVAAPVSAVLPPEWARYLRRVTRGIAIERCNYPYVTGRVRAKKAVPR